MTRLLEAKITIPIQYDGDKSPQIKKFLEEAGEDIQPAEKLTIRKKDFEGKVAEIVILKQLTS